MATQKDHRTKAEELLALGRTYPHNSAARLATFTEAHVEATLALFDLTAAIATPQRIVVNQTIEPGDFKPSPAPLLVAADDFGTQPHPEVAEALKAPSKPARRSRKAAPAKEADK